MEQTLSEKLAALSKKAGAIGASLPLTPDTDALGQPIAVAGHDLPNRLIYAPAPCFDAAESGAPTAATVTRYSAAVQERCYAQIWLELTAIDESGRRDPHQLMLTAENIDVFAAFVRQLRATAKALHGAEPQILITLDHAGREALSPVVMEPTLLTPEGAEVISDTDLRGLIVTCANVAQYAAEAGFDGYALNAADRSLFGESLASFHRDRLFNSPFGGDFDDRTRFLRDCYTAAYMTAPTLIPAIRLTLSDGIAQPDGWGMSFENETHPDVCEPSMLLNVLHALYGVSLVNCTIGIPGVNWMNGEPESELIRVSRLCSCIAMIDSNLQENVQLILPESGMAEIPFDNLAAGMVGGEFASFAAYL